MLPLYSFFYIAKHHWNLQFWLDKPRRHVTAPVSFLDARRYEFIGLGANEKYDGNEDKKQYVASPNVSQDTIEKIISTLNKKVLLFFI